MYAVRNGYISGSDAIRESVMTTRVQLELGPKGLKRLKEIRDITEAGSYVEVVKQSLAIYERMIKIEQEFFIVDFFHIVFDRCCGSDNNRRFSGRFT